MLSKLKKNCFADHKNLFTNVECELSPSLTLGQCQNEGMGFLLNRGERMFTSK
jgi:hypothetical protein